MRSFLSTPQRALFGFVVSILVLFLALLWRVMTGQADLSPTEIFEALANLGEESVTTRIILDYRFARLLVALMAGAQLSVSGAILQGITRNALASPDLVGITGGAGLAAVVAILVFPEIPSSTLPFIAIVGGTLTGLTVYLLAWKDGVA